MRHERRGLECSPALQKVEDQHDDGENEEDVYPRTERGTTDQADDPKNEEDDGNGPKHLGRSPMKLEF
jgi:hypothetical protein